jgi:hypothetical protein
MELVPETLYSNKLMRLCAREDYIERECLVRAFKWFVYTGKITCHFRCAAFNVAH